jgi:transcriptional regulator with GAF, ATPase, and Fis domain
MRELCRTIDVVAASSARIVLLLGPYGVGKGFTARTITMRAAAPQARSPSSTARRCPATCSTAGLTC